MQRSTIKLIFAHPLVQLLSFCVLFFCGEVVCVPFIIMIRFAIVTGQPFAVLGLLGLVLCLASLFIKRFALQVWGLAAMWLSLILHVIQVNPAARPYLVQYPLQYVLLVLFFIVTTVVILKMSVWKNY